MKPSSEKAIKDYAEARRAKGELLGWVMDSELSQVTFVVPIEIDPKSYRLKLVAFG
jgi:hypothetical protein